MKVFGRIISDEFGLLAACCRWPASVARNEDLAARSAGPLDWDQFVALARRHRVEGLAQRALKEAGVTIPPAAALAARAADIAVQNLVQAGETLRISRSLEAAGVQPLFLKGVTLGVLVYDSLGVKQSWDIDLVVRPADAGTAAAALRAAGYQRTYPDAGLDDAAFARWMEHYKESLWQRPGSRLYVELHTALVDNPRLLQGVTADSPAQSVPLAGGEIRTLAPDALYTYLVVHGATHGWSRLKWLADVAGLLAQAGADGIIRLHQGAERLGGGRSSAQALLLCEALLALPLPERLREALHRDRPARWLAGIAVGAMAGRGATELDDTMFGTVPLNVAHFLLGRGLGFKASELLRKLSHPEDRMLLPLPRALHFLYPVLAPPLWVVRRYRVSRHKGVNE